MDDDFRITIMEENRRDIDELQRENAELKQDAAVLRAMFEGLRDSHRVLIGASITLCASIVASAIAFVVFSGGHP